MTTPPARLFILLAVTTVALAGCAMPPGPRPLTDSGKRVESNGFSVMPPQGPDWFTEENPHGIAFYKKLASDRFTTPQGRTIDAPRSFVILVSLVRPGSLKLGSATDLEGEHATHGQAGISHRSHVRHP
jgi:hypothetical protein